MRRLLTCQMFQIDLPLHISAQLMHFSLLTHCNIISCLRSMSKRHSAHHASIERGLCWWNATRSYYFSVKYSSGHFIQQPVQISLENKKQKNTTAAAASELEWMSSYGLIQTGLVLSYKTENAHSSVGTGYKDYTAFYLLVNELLKLQRRIQTHCGVGF